MRKFLIAALSSFMCQTVPLAGAVPRHKAQQLEGSGGHDPFLAVFMGRYQPFVSVLTALEVVVRGLNKPRQIVGKGRQDVHRHQRLYKGLVVEKL